MNLSFQNKVALVTGAGSGMGLVTARVFAEAGAAVALSDVNEKAVRSAADQLVAAGHKAIGIRCNVADEADVETMVAQSVSTFGRLDAAFNNAGVQSPAKEIADVSGEEFDRVNGINLRGVWNCMKTSCAKCASKDYYRGLSPHQFMPMSGVHSRLQPTAPGAIVRRCGWRGRRSVAARGLA